MLEWLYQYSMLLTEKNISWRQDTNVHFWNSIQGPVFSLIGAWLVYQSQNKQVIDKDVSESMFWQAVIAASLSFLLSIFGGIDNW